MATLAAADRLLVLGEPVGALAVVSCHVTHTEEDGHKFTSMAANTQKEIKLTNKSERYSPPAGLLSPQAVWPAATVNEGRETTTHQSAASKHQEPPSKTKILP